MKHLFLLVLLIPIFVVKSMFHEKKIWNDGVCVKTGMKWVMFDTDSQGGRGYKDSYGNYIWISFNFIDREYNKKH